MKSAYLVLGLASEKATAEEIERAYARLSDEFKNHPDSQRALDEALATLSDPLRRAAHDRALNQAATRSAPEPPSVLPWFALGGLALAALGYAYSLRTQPPVVDTPPLAAAPPAPPALPLPAKAPEPEAILFLPALSLPVETRPAPAKPDEAVIEPPRFVRPGKKTKGFDAPYLTWVTYLVIGKHGRGSGVMVAKDKIMTNCHVIAGNTLSGLFVINSATRESTQVDKYARLVDDEDVCLLNAPGAPEYLAEWGRSETLDPGDATHTVSFPGNEGLTWSAGQLLRRETPLGMEVLVTSNYCRPGVSGGPLFDEQGRLIGITSAIRISRGGIECMSLTAETARQVLYKPMVPIALAPNYYNPAMLRQ